MSEPLAKLERDIADLAEDDPEAAAEMSASLKADFQAHDRKWRPWRVCSEAPCSRSCDFNTGCKTESEAMNKRIHDWMVWEARDSREVDMHRERVAAMTARDLRQRSRLSVWCSDCSLAIAYVLPISGRDLLVTRTKARAFEGSVWVDGAFWGDVTYCKRKQYALRTSELAGLLESGSQKLALTHDLKINE